jgi:uncharacterized membrane protein
VQAIRDRLESWWFEIRGSLWLIPALLTAGAMVLAWITVQIDQVARFDLDETTWVFSAGSEGARGVLSAIAGTMMTVTALVFSITIVALQLAASQLTPRVLRSVMADRGNQVVLGVFIATFTYALVVLRAVRSPIETRGGFVPSLSVSILIALALVSVALLIYFMHHSANNLRAAVVIARVTEATRGLIATLYPEEIGRPVSRPPAFPGRPYVVAAGRSGYLQVIGADTLFALAEERALTIEPIPRVGDFVLPGAPLATIWFDGPIDDALSDAVRAGFVLGHERTMQHDVGFGFQQLADIGIRALSPGVNDPTTATVVVDNLAALLVELANRGHPVEVREDEDGVVRLILRGPPFADLVDVAFAQIAHYGAGDPVFSRHLAATLDRMAPLIPEDRRRDIEAMRLVVAAEHVPASTSAATV